MDRHKERFNSKYKIINGCWVWQDFLTDGYGRIKINKIYCKAHRFSYSLFYGEIPAGLVIDHICRNRACVNPQHLRCVTRTQNSLENSMSVCAFNKLKQSCPQGHPYDRIYANGKHRECSICKKENNHRYHVDRMKAKFIYFKFIFHKIIF